MPAAASFSTSPDARRSAMPLDATPGEQAQEDQCGQNAGAVDPSRSLHHLALRLGPVLLLREQPDVRPLQGGWQVAVLGFGIPEAERSASRSSALPRRVSLCLRVSQSRKEWTKIIVCEYVVLPARCGLLHLRLASLPGRWA